jgi:hypothetical protein
VRSVTIHWAFAAAAGLGIIALWSLFLIDLRARQAVLRKERDAMNAALAPAGKNAGPIQGTGSGG